LFSLLLFNPDLGTFFNRLLQHCSCLLLPVDGVRHLIDHLSLDPLHLGDAPGFDLHALLLLDEPLDVVELAVLDARPPHPLQLLPDLRLLLANHSRLRLVVLDEEAQQVLLLRVRLQRLDLARVIHVLLHVRLLRSDRLNVMFMFMFEFIDVLPVLAEYELVPPPGVHLEPVLFLDGELHLGVLLRLPLGLRDARHDPPLFYVQQLDAVRHVLLVTLDLLAGLLGLQQREII
jgi:hypothetical protein